MAASFLPWILSPPSSSSTKLTSGSSFFPSKENHFAENEKVIVDYQTPRSNVQPPTPTSWLIKLEQSINIFLTDSVIKVLDTLYHDRDYPRFFVLETIARVPYFVVQQAHEHLLYLFFTCTKALVGGEKEYLKVHFAESWNEMHHLLIMEVGCTCNFCSVLRSQAHVTRSWGGNAWWFDRFLAQHIAIFYYFMTVFMYALSPRMAYHLSECVESHAFETDDKFIKEKGDELKKLPPSKVVVKYYTEEDLYLFDGFQTSRLPNTRRPIIQNMYDVFMNIRDDEAEHCKTVKACQTHGNLRSPHASQDDDLGCILPDAECEDIVDCIKKSITNPPDSHKS